MPIISNTLKVIPSSQQFQLSQSRPASYKKNFFFKYFDSATFSTLYEAIEHKPPGGGGVLVRIESPPKEKLEPFLLSPITDLSDSEYSGTTNRFTWFSDHKQLLEYLHNTHNALRVTSVYEHVLDDKPRNLFFDLDGDLLTCYSKHHQIIEELTKIVNWFFEVPNDFVNSEPYVISSNFSSKYSVHLVFPHIQFDGYEEQCGYIFLFLNVIRSARWQADKGVYYEPTAFASFDSSTHVKSSRLGDVIDFGAYRRNQSLRTPYSCKLRLGRYSYSTFLSAPKIRHKVDKYDECSLFIGYCESDRKIKLPDIKEIMKRDLVRNVLRDFGNVGVVNRYPLDRHIPHSPAAGLNKTPSLSVAVLDVRFRHTLKESLDKSGKDDETMPDDAIRKHFAVEKIDMTGQSDVTRLEKALHWINERRADYWHSWFLLMGLTANLMMKEQNIAETGRLLAIFLHWSRKSKKFIHEENLRGITNAIERRMNQRHLPTFESLRTFVEFDNPHVQFEWSCILEGKSVGEYSNEAYS